MNKLLVVCAVAHTLVVAVSSMRCDVESGFKQIVQSKREEQLRRLTKWQCPQITLFGCFSDEGEGSCRTSECTRDFECQWNEVCCRNECNRNFCVAPISRFPKPGSCPTFNQSPCFLTLVADFVPCRFDGDCSGNRKCCRNENTDCDEARCFDPEFA